MTKKRVKFGLIGCGKVVVNRHLPALKSLNEAEIVAVADINRENLNLVADKLQIEKRFLNHMELLKDPEVEAVGVCVPLRSHFEIASAVLNAGKHLLLEKPLTMSMDDADLLVDQASKVDRKVMLGLTMRWHRLIRQAGEIIEKGVLGPIGMINVIFSTGHYKRPIPEWRLHRETGGGNLIENGTHFYDLWRFFLKSEIQEITAVSRSTDRCDDEPCAVTALSSEGVLLNCVLSDFLPDQNVIEIFGQKSVLRVSLHRFDGLELMPLHSSAGDIKNRFKSMWRFMTGVPHAISQARYGGDFCASFRAQWNHFIDCIRRDKPVECTFEDGRKALQVAMAAVKSASTGKSVKVSQAPREIVTIATDDTLNSKEN